MKRTRMIESSLMACLAIGLLAGTARAQSTAYWTNSSGGEWNTAVDWNVDLTGFNAVPGAGTNADVGSQLLSGAIVNYDNPMSALSIGALTLSGPSGTTTLNIDTTGFVVDVGNITTIPITINNAGVLSVNASGVLTVTNGGTVTINTGGAMAVNGNAIFTGVSNSAASLSDLGTLTLDSGGTLLVTNSTALGIGASAATGSLTVNNGNIVMTNTIGSGGLNVGVNTRYAASSSAASYIQNGGTVTLDKLLTLAGSTSGNTGIGSVMTINGGVLNCFGNSRINNTTDDGGQKLVVNGGQVNLGNFNIAKSIPGAGLLVSNGVVTATSMAIGTGGSRAFAQVYGGTVTNTGVFDVYSGLATSASSDRKGYFYQRGGLVVSTGSGGVVICGTNGASTSNMGGVYELTGGTLMAQQVTLLRTTSLTNTSARLTVGGSGVLYLGSGGLVVNPGTNTSVNCQFTNGATIGAIADWAGTGPMSMSGSVVFQAADPGGAGHNIALSGPLTGSGAPTVVGNGSVTLNGTNTYSGATTIDSGSLVLGATGSIANSAQIIVASGATFDVSAVNGGFVHAAGRTLGGFGQVVGAVTTASGAIINPGSNTVNGTLTFATSVTETGGAFNHFDLVASPSSPNNDRITINGDFNVSGTNTVEVAGAGGPGSIYPLISYGGNFNGGLANLALSGASGFLSNNAVIRTIYLVVANPVRNPTNVTWVGNSVANIWDTINHTNWSNNGNLDYFVAGDNVSFNATGAANPVVNLVGNNSPSSVTVDAAATYVITGSGAISGSTSLVKTNSGTLTMLATNSYTGATILGSGVFEASSLVLSGNPSSIGAAASDPTNLVFAGAALRYLGPSTTTDRGMTLEVNGTVDVTNGGTALTLSGSITGAGALTKVGPGRLTLPTANTYGGGTIISNGTFQVNASGAAGAAGITNEGSSLRLGSAFTLGNAVDFEGICTVDLSNAGGDSALDGAWTGSGVVTIINQQSSRVFTMGGNGSGGGNMSEFSGTVSFGTNSGSVRFNDGGGNPNLGSTNATFDLGTGTGTMLARNGGITIELGALTGGPGTRLSGRGNGTAATLTYSIGARNLSTTFAGTIQDGGSPTAIAKVGSGALLLSGTNTYTGATTVSSGLLQVDGELGVTTVTVSGGTLGGNGVISGSVEIQAGATLAPGDSVGQLTVSNSLVLDFGCTNVFELNASAGTNDSVVGLTSVTYGGILIVTNLSGTPAAGSVYTLFAAPAATYAGAFDSIVLPPLPSDRAWDTTSLSVDGTLKVVSVPLPVFTAITKSGSNLIMTGTNGPASGTYYVLTSTNVALHLSQWSFIQTNNFQPDGSFAVTNAIVSGEPKRFFVLFVP